jgi:tetratricopeptide (TPR) repeat protein
MTALILLVLSAVFATGQTPWQSLSAQAKQHQEAEDFAAAESLRRQALQLAEKQLGPANKQLAPLLQDLAFTLHATGHDAEAEPLIFRAYTIAKESGDSRMTGLMLNVLGIVLSAEGQRARAEPVLRRSVALLEEAEGEDSILVAKALNNLATLYLDIQQFPKAEEEMRRSLPIYEKTLKQDDPEMALVWWNMFTVLASQHRAAEGEPYLRKALAIGEKVFPNTAKMANLQVCLAAYEVSRNNFKEAARLLEEAIATQERVLGQAHPELAHSLAAYATVMHHLHQKSEAKNALNRANMILKSALGDVK